MRRTVRRCRGERGIVTVFFALILTLMLGLAAVLVDLGQLRSSSRYEQLYVDLAALAAGKQLSVGDPNAACKDAITYLNINDTRISPTINASTFCSSITTACSNASTEHTPSTTVGSVTVSVHFPVPASEIRDSRITGGARLNDGVSQCQRMRVLVSTRDAGMFSRVFGIASSTTSRSATMRPSANPGSPPALWLLDPTGCVPLKVDGGSQVTVGTSTVQGVITIDSDGSTCSGSSSTVSSTGSGTIVQAVGPPSGSTTGRINLVALPNGSTSCSLPACASADVSGGNLAPQPVHGDAATRAYIDWKYNCKTTYPAYHGVTINPCPNTASSGGTSYPYIDNLNTVVGSSGTPSGTWTVIKDQGQNKPCSAGNFDYPVGNYYVNCSKGNNGYVLNGRTVTFEGGNIVFEDSVSVSNNGSLNINTGNTNASLSASCTTPSVQTPCMGQAFSLASSSTKAATVYFRGDSSTSFSTSGGGSVNLNHVFVYGGTGSVAFSGAPPTWTAPTEGPFSGLAYWTDMPSTATNAQLSSFTITGGSGASLTGVFFTPEASPFKLAGGGNWGQQHAQFISYQLAVTGGGVLTMAPDPSAVSPPSFKGYLIR